MDTWKNCVLSAGKPLVHKIPRSVGGGGRGNFGFGGGGSADFIFMGAGIFLNFCSMNRSEIRTPNLTDAAHEHNVQKT